MSDTSDAIYKVTGAAALGFLLAMVLIGISILMSGCAGRHAYSSTDPKTDPDREQYMGTRYYDGHFHDLWCKRDQKTGDRVCRFE